MADGNPRITVSNRSKQTIALQVRRKGGDFFLEEYQLRLRPRGLKGSHTTVPKNYLNWSQVENLAGRGMLSVTENKS